MKSTEYNALCDLCPLDPSTFLTSSPTTFPFVHSTSHTRLFNVSGTVQRYFFLRPLHMLLSVSEVLVSGYVHSPQLYFFQDVLKMPPSQCGHPLYNYNTAPRMPISFTCCLFLPSTDSNIIGCIFYTHVLIVFSPTRTEAPRAQRFFSMFPSVSPSN